MKPEILIRILTICSLAGLLLAVGLRLTFSEVAESVRRCRFLAILLLNFLAVPLLAALMARWAGLGQDATAALVLLGAAPFAPVVPVFARMARADLALAAGLTTVYPVLSAFITPWVCGFLLEQVTGLRAVEFRSAQVMAVLVATITLPLLAGMGLNHAAPSFSKRWLRPVEVLSEATGALSLAYVTYTEFGAIFGMGWKSALATILVFEVCLWSGYSLAREKGSRRVIGLGTSNRNIALALLVALQSFPGLHVVSGVVGSGLLLILLGLIHVGWWRWRDHASGAAAAASSRTVSLNQPP